ncbi:MAG: alpha/beta hydrolase [Candidatus Eremiobacteraeota bacterium]|nr:alpha/beta hydrolase [Candidatus Eremiobacteraeota bacterium]
MNHSKHGKRIGAFALAIFGIIACTYIQVNATMSPSGPHGSASAALQRELGMLNPQMAAVIRMLVGLKGKPIATLSAQAARLQPSPADAVKALLVHEGRSAAPRGLASVVDSTIPGPAGPLAVRIYTPAGKRPMPGLVYFHGGGWVIAGINTYDASARALAALSHHVVVSVAYRQAPEHKFPAAIEDSYAATQWVIKNGGSMGIDAADVSVGGESAGGNLATVVTMMARDRHGMMPVHQLLVYPITDYAFDTVSYQQNAMATPLNRAAMMWFFRQYLRSAADGSNPYVSPLRGNVNGLPPATVLTAEVDPLRSEGVAYANKLRSAGIRVHSRYYAGVTHEFFGMSAAVDSAKQANAFAAADLP